MGPMPSAADPSRRALDGPALESLVGSLADVGGDGPSDLDLLAVLHQLERVKAAVAAAQARVTVTFAASQERAAQAARNAAKGQGFEAWRAARDRFPGVGEQVGLARRLSPWQGRAQLTFATDLLTDLPCTLAALTTGAISEWRAGIIARETTWLSAADRVAVDAEVAGDRVALARLGNLELTRAVTAAAYRRDPQGALARARAAENDRNVSIRPKPDAMCRISALLPVAQGVATYAALSQAADAARAEGDPRSAVRSWPTPSSSGSPVRPAPPPYRSRCRSCSAMRRCSAAARGRSTRRRSPAMAPSLPAGPAT